MPLSPLCLAWSCASWSFRVKGSEPQPHLATGPLPGAALVSSRCRKTYGLVAETAYVHPSNHCHLGQGPLHVPLDPSLWAPQYFYHLGLDRRLPAQSRGLAGSEDKLCVVQ